MNNEFDICGTHIAFSEIKDYRLVQREYIYRPYYKEKQNSLIKLLSSKKYEFVQMVPYAAIINENEYNLALKKSKSNSLPTDMIKDVAIGVISNTVDKFGILDIVKESVIKDIAVGAISNVTDKFNIPFKSQKYHCINTAGRVFTIDLKDIPAVVMQNDGRVSDVKKGHELYQLIGQSITPTILTVPALSISTTEDYLFFGNGIQIDNVEMAYSYLRQCMITYQQEHPNRITDDNAPRHGIQNIVRKFLPNSNNRGN